MSAGSGYTPPAEPECAYEPRMTRAEAIALRDGGLLDENCVVVVTDGPTIGTTGNTSPTEIELNPTAPDDLGLTARVNTTFDDSAWAGLYDIDLGTDGSIIELTDNWGNTARDVDSDSSTAHTQVPWHRGGTNFRDNFFEDATLIGFDVDPGRVSGTTIRGATVNLTGRTAGSMDDSVIIGGTVIAPGNFFNFNGCTARNGFSTLDFDAGVASGTASVTRCDFTATTLTRDATATGSISMSGSKLDGATITQGAGSSGALTVTNSELHQSSCQLNIDPGSAKSISVLACTLQGYSIRTQDAGGAAVSLSRCTLNGKPNSAAQDSITCRGSGAGLTMINTVADGAKQILVDGPAAGATIQNASIQDSSITVGPGAGAFQSLSTIYNGAVIEALSPERLTLNWTNIQAQGTVRHALAATGAFQIQGGRVDDGIVELLSGGRRLDLANTDVLGGSRIRCTATGSGNTLVHDCNLRSDARIDFEETGASPCGVYRTDLIGSPIGVGSDGVLTFDGSTSDVSVSNCYIEGTVTLTDVPDGGLGSPTSFFDNKIGPQSVLTYTGGDDELKQIRHNEIRGASTVNLVGLTGAAGGGNADLFASLIRDQSTLTITGERVPGQPVRNVEVARGSVLNVEPDGTCLQVRVSEGAELNTGAFRHSESIVEGAFIKTATAPNVNKLCNVSFDNWV